VGSLTLAAPRAAPTLLGLRSIHPDPRDPQAVGAGLLREEEVSELGGGGRGDDVVRDLVGHGAVGEEFGEEGGLVLVLVLVVGVHGRHVLVVVLLLLLLLLHEELL
jgi:hypothetical protein